MRVWIAFILLILLIAGVNYGSKLAADCPSKTYGTNNETYIKYFSSPLCMACWLQKPILERLEAEKGDRFLIEEYNVDMCRDAAAPHYIRGVPAFIINDTVVYGVLGDEAFDIVIP